jgi:hypothetical protein
VRDRPPDGRPERPGPGLHRRLRVHSSLFLPTLDDRYVEYAAGDWGYAVENRNLPQDAVGALAASRGAAFGRLYHDRVPGRAMPNPAHKPFTLKRVDCERADVIALVDKLDVRYERLAERHGRPTVNPENGVAWVRDDGARYGIAKQLQPPDGPVARGAGVPGQRRGRVVEVQRGRTRRPPAGRAAAPPVRADRGELCGRAGRVTSGGRQAPARNTLQSREAAGQP